MDFSNILDSLILLISGVLICLYGSGKLFSELANKEPVNKGKMKIVLIIGSVIIFAGIVPLMRKI
jgi:divalent metal cation (Fe/Co/Zn/Cd) transporter